MVRGERRLVEGGELQGREERQRTHEGHQHTNHHQAARAARHLLLGLGLDRPDVRLAVLVRRAAVKQRHQIEGGVSSERPDDHGSRP